MTDSVNCVAFFDPVSFDMPLRWGALTLLRSGLWWQRLFLLRGRCGLPRRCGFLRRCRDRRHRGLLARLDALDPADVAVQATVVVGRTQDLLHVELCFRIRNV